MTQIRWWFPNSTSPIRVGLQKNYGAACDYAEVRGLNLITDAPAGGVWQMAMWDPDIVYTLPDGSKQLFNPTQAAGGVPSKILSASADGSDVTVQPALWAVPQLSDFEWQQVIEPVLAPWAWRIRFASTHKGTDHHPKGYGNYEPFLLPSMTHVFVHRGGQVVESDIPKGQGTQEGPHVTLSNGDADWIIAADLTQDLAFGWKYDTADRSFGANQSFDAMHIAAYPLLTGWDNVLKTTFVFAIGTIQQVKNIFQGLPPIPVRSNNLKSKLTWHISGVPDAGKLESWIQQAQPTMVKGMDVSDMELNYLRTLSPNSLFVFRHYVNADYKSMSADAFFTELQSTGLWDKLRGKGIVWEGINEPVVQNVDDAGVLDAWYLRFAAILHSYGEKVAAFSFSTGNPPAGIAPLLAASAAACDYIALHEYHSPTAGYAMIGQYAQFLAALPAASQKPVLITETGTDDGANGGWQKYYTASQYMDILAKIDTFYAGDPRVVGASIYELGAGGTWATFEISPIAPSLASYIATANVVPIQPPAPPPPPAPINARGADFSSYQGAIDWTQVKLDFAFIKASEGTAIVDGEFAANWKGAKAQGIPRGAFHFYRNLIDPVLQANAFCSLLAADKGELLPVVDVENVQGDTSKADPDALALFCATVQSKLGVLPVIYTRVEFWDGASYWTRAFTWTLNTPLWIADYTPGISQPGLPSDWKGKTWLFWQYGQGPVGTIAGNVDLDYFNGTVDQLKAYIAGLQPPAPPPPPPPPPPPTPKPSPVPADKRLAAYPRPQNDNGMGIHFRLNLKETDAAPLVSQGVSWAQQLKVKWALVAGQDWNQILLGAKALYAVGIMPVCRLICKIDGNWNFVQGVQLLQSAGIPAYVQIFNEPGDDREWRNAPDIARFGASWASQAIAVFDAGGYPGLQVLGQDEFAAAINSLKAAKRTDVLQKAFFALHNYGSNHPADYPYDALNQKDHPGATVMTDDTCVLRFLEYKQWMLDAFGFCLPFLGGEGGWEWGDDEDNRYPKLSDADHARLHVEMFQWFATGLLSNGQALPDELFSVCPWIMADWGMDDWFGNNPKNLTISSVAGLPTFVRQFGAAAVQPPAPPPPPVPPPVPPPPPPPVPPPPSDIVFKVEPAGTVVAGFPGFIGVAQGAMAVVKEIGLLTDQPSSDPASQLGININVDIRDANGLPLDDELVIQKWPDGSSAHYTIGGQANFQMFASFRDGQPGPYSVTYRDAVVSGLGLWDNHHVQWVILFEQRS